MLEDPCGDCMVVRVFKSMENARSAFLLSHMMIYIGALLPNKWINFCINQLFLTVALQKPSFSEEFSSLENVIQVFQKVSWKHALLWSLLTEYLAIKEQQEKALEHLKLMILKHLKTLSNEFCGILYAWTDAHHEGKSYAFFKSKCQECNMYPKIVYYICMIDNQVGGLKKAKEDRFVEFFSSYVTEAQWSWDVTIHKFQLRSEVKHFDIRKVFNGDLEACSSFLKIMYVDLLKSRSKRNILNFKGGNIATYCLEEPVMKNKNETVERWLVKWKWKHTISGVVSYCDPWGQGSFEGERIVMCLTRCGVLNVISIR